MESQPWWAHAQFPRRYGNRDEARFDRQWPWWFGHQVGARFVQQLPWWGHQDEARFDRQWPWWWHQDEARFDRPLPWRFGHRDEVLQLDRQHYQTWDNLGSAHYYFANTAASDDIGWSQHEYFLSTEGRTVLLGQRGVRNPEDQCHTIFLDPVIMDNSVWLLPFWTQLPFWILWTFFVIILHPTGRSKGSLFKLTSYCTSPLM